MQRRSYSLSFALCLFGLAGVATGCAESELQAQEELEPRSLVAFSGCEDLLAYVKSEMDKSLEASYQKKQYPGIPGMSGGPSEKLNDAAEKTPASGAKDNGASVPDHSKTNVQEVGIDEPDQVKTDGRRMFTHSRGVVRIVDLQGEKAKVTDRIELEGKNSASDLLVFENRLLIIERHRRFDNRPDHSDPSFRLTELDISTPGQAKILSTLDLDGHYVSARMMGSVVRLVFRTPPKDLDIRSAWQFLNQDSSGVHAGSAPMDQPAKKDKKKISPIQSDEAWNHAVQKARLHNRGVLAAMTERNLIPRYRLSKAGAPVEEGLAYGCDQAMRPGVAAGIELLSVLSIDLAQGLSRGGGGGVIASGGTTYASDSALYVATRSWGENAFTNAAVQMGPGGSGVPQPGQAQAAVDQNAPSLKKTYIHKFDLSDPTKAVYRASGEVNGVLLNQFAMSEHAGVLRVAATRYVNNLWAPTDSFVATLQEQGNKLNQLGYTGGLGKTEMIRSVRYMGDVGYVVTFRQTDPLYTLDLSQPAAPQVLGELKIEGFSAYLHPLSPGYLLGVGRDANQQGQIRGLQVSIFDVRDLRSPKRIHNYTLDNAASNAQFDHRAFLYWPKTKSLVLPVTGWNRQGNGYDNFVKALVLNADAEKGIALQHEIEHPDEVVKQADGAPTKFPDYQMPTRIERSVVVGDRLWTMSHMGMKANQMQSMADIDWLEYK